MVFLASAVLRILIRDLGSGAFIIPNPGSGMGNNPGPVIRDEHPGSYF
jgi:hypothetical protein